MPNPLAYAVLIFWPVVMIVLFRKLPPAQALTWSILGGYLLLPQKIGFDMPLIPPLTKDSIPSIAAFLIYVLMLRRRIALLSGPWSLKILVLLFVAGPFFTVAFNADPAIWGAKFLPGLRLYDAVSVVVGQFVFVMPFFVARVLIRTEEDFLSMLRIFVYCALVYSVLILIEVRMSPQLNNWIYGYFPSTSFLQQIRFGGFRPIVFLGHGLKVSFFIAISILALITYRKALANGAKRLAGLG